MFLGGATRHSGVLEAFLTLPFLHIVQGNSLRRIYEFKKSFMYPNHYSIVDEFYFEQMRSHHAKNLCKCALHVICS